MNARKMIALGMLGGGFHNIPAPDAAFSFLPFTIQQDGRRFRPAPPWAINSAAPTGKAYYVSPTGLDTNDGLTIGAPLRSIKTAFLKADVDIVYALTGAYSNNFMFVQSSPTRNISFIAVGGPVYLGTFAEVVWTADGAAYKATRSNVLKVLDATNPDANGDWTALTSVADAATCQATVNSWYTDNVTLWVHTFDSRLPTTTIRPFFTSGNYVGLANTGNQVCYFENFHFEGGILGAFSLGNATNPVTAYFKDCSFKYSSANGLTSLAGGVSYLQNCTASRNVDDGFNYHKNSGAIPYGVEIDCIGRDNGVAADIDNGSSMHDGGRIVRINGEYMRNIGRNIHDVTASTASWNLGVNAHDGASAVNDCNFAVGDPAGDNAKMWLDSCISTGSATDLEIANTATGYVRNFVSGGVFIGTPTGY